MKPLITQKSKFPISKTFIQYIRTLIGLWAIATIPFLLATYLYISFSIKSEINEHRKFFETFLTEIFVRQSRFGDVVNSKELISSIGKTSNLGKLYVCNRGIDAFGDLKQIVCPSQLTPHPIDIAGNRLELKYEWKTAQSETGHILSAILLVYVISFLGLIALAIYTFRIVSIRITEVAHRITGATSNADLSALGKMYPELGIVADAVQDFNQRNYENASKIVELQIFQTTVNLARQVAHDIRSPLNVLRLLKGDKSTVSAELTDKAIDRIDSIAADLLAIKSNSGLFVEKQTIGENFFNTLVELKRLEFANKRLQIAFLVKIEKEITLGLSRSVIFRIVSNLINNSVEAAISADIEPRVTLEVINVTSGIKISVSDNGPGFESAILENIDQGLFLNNKLQVQGQTSGFGLGLNYVKQEIEKAKGKFTISTMPGNGTTVELVVPYIEKSNGY